MNEILDPEILGFKQSWSHILRRTIHILVILNNNIVKDNAQFSSMYAYIHGSFMKSCAFSNNCGQPSSNRANPYKMSFWKNNPG